MHCEYACAWANGVCSVAAGVDTGVVVAVRGTDATLGEVGPLEQAAKTNPSAAVAAASFETRMISSLIRAVIKAQAALPGRIRFSICRRYPRAATIWRCVC